jgi:hypothetical protein
VRFRIAISAGLAAVIVLSVFTMIKFDSRVAAEEAEIDDLISTGVVPTVADFSVKQDLITGIDNSQQGETGDFVMSESAEDVESAIAAQVVEPELEPVYVYPDGSIAPAPSDLLSGSSGEIDYEFDDWDDDHERHEDDHDDWDDDHEEEWDDDDRDFIVGNLIGRLFSERDHDDDDDDDDHDRDHDDDDDDDHDRDHDDD